MQETWVRSLGQEDPLEKGMATHSSILAWRITWTEKPGGLQSMGHDWATTLSLVSGTVVDTGRTAINPFFNGAFLIFTGKEESETL